MVVAAEASCNHGCNGTDFRRLQTVTATFIAANTATAIMPATGEHGKLELTGPSCQGKGAYQQMMIDPEAVGQLVATGGLQVQAVANIESSKHSTIKRSCSFVLLRM